MNQGMTMGNQSMKLSRAVQTEEPEQSRASGITDAKGLSGVSTAAETALVLVHTWCFTWCRNTADHS